MKNKLAWLKDHSVVYYFHGSSLMIADDRFSGAWIDATEWSIRDLRHWMGY